MDIPNTNTKKRRFKHLSIEERSQIQILLKIGKTPSEIFRELTRDRATICREIKRGKVQQLKTNMEYTTMYFPDVGQRIYNENRAKSGDRIKLGQDIKVAAYIDNEILNNKLSPDVVAFKLKTAGFKMTLCTKTIYNYIQLQMLKTRNIDLLLKVKRKNRVKQARENKKIYGKSIEERPTVVADREEIGHWEIDTVIGKKEGQEAVLLTLTERITNKEIIVKIPGKNAESVQSVMIDIRKQWGEKFDQVFKTITADNGSEFAELSSLEKDSTAKIYYAHPYSSWERAINENHNGLIRRFIPKGESLNNCSLELIEFIENWCNNLPRKRLGYSTPNELFELFIQGILFGNAPESRTPFAV